MGAPGEPLLTIPLPEGARFLGLSRDAPALGVGAGEGASLEVLGPLPPGDSSFGYRYRLPVGDDGAELTLRYPQEVDVLNLLVADTGVVIEDERLHRRRPFRSGTRVYLHREGFRIEPDETLRIHFRHLERGALPTRAALVFVLLVAAAGAWFLTAPLRPRAGAAPEEAPPADALSRERENVIEALRDLEHDHETGKIADADYAGMRSELRGKALSLLELERSQAARPEAAATATDADADGPAPDVCPACGEKTDPAWRFCSHCGGTLDA